jgi:hypothetical protein
MSRGSSAVQAGAGLHLNLSERLDLSFTTQYMMHLGKDIHAHVHEDGEEHFSRTLPNQFLGNRHNIVRA